MTRRALAVLLLCLGLLAAAVTPACAASKLPSHPRWMTEAAEFQYFGAWQQVMRRQGDLMLSEPPAQAATDVIHYTRVPSCAGLVARYMTPCASVTDSPPAAGQFAMLDLEPWTLTDAAEQAAPCASDAAFAAQMVSLGVTPVLTFWSGSAWHMDCAAVAAGTDGWIVLDAADHGRHPATFLAQLNKAWKVVHAANPLLPASHIIFGLSTRWKYHVSPALMARAYQTVIAAHPMWTCWVNVITFDHSQWKAARFAALVEA